LTVEQQFNPILAIASAASENYKSRITTHKLKSILIFFLILISGNIFSQNLAGRFIEDNDHISFENGYANFKIGGNGGITFYYCGEGKYEIINDFLLIHTSKFKGENSIINPIDTISDQVELTVNDIKGNAIQGAFVALLDGKGKLISGGISNDKGISLLNRSSQIKQVKVSFVGMDNLTFDYNQNCNYIIELAPIDIIESQTVVFKVTQSVDNSLSLILLTFDFNPRKNTTKELHRLERKTKKYQFRERTFNK